MPDNFSKNIIYLSDAQRQELFANNTITVDGVTVNYNDNDIYVTPQAEPVTDVKVNGTSVSQNGTANIPVANGSNFGVVKVLDAQSYGVRINSGGALDLYPTPSSKIKEGAVDYLAINPKRQHESVFYGLSKAAGADMASSSNPVGTYTDAAKQSIQNMLGITDLISTEESSTATAAHALNSTFMMNGKLHRATAAIAIGDAVEEGTNCQVVKVEDVFVKKTDYANSTTPGVIRVGAGLQMAADGQRLYTFPAHPTQIKGGTETYKPIDPAHQHESVFYGLSKVAGVDLANEIVTLGTYPETSKAAIRTMLGAASPDVIAISDTQPTNADTKVWLPETQAAGVEVPTMADMNTALAGKVSDVQIHNTSIVQNGIANIPFAGGSIAGTVRVGSAGGLYVNPNNGVLQASASLTNEVKAGTEGFKCIVPLHQHEAAFYGLAKAAGDSTQAASDNAVGTYTADASAAIRTMLGAVGDVQVNGASVLSQGVANVPIADANNPGVIKVESQSTSGLTVDGTTKGIRIVAASSNVIKAESSSRLPIVPYYQHESVFYGLAKAAGDATQSASSNAVGTYTAEAKAAIQSMLGIDLSSIAAEVEIPLVETVSGTTPTITGQPNTRYNCGEVTTISITPPASGSIDVYFESGSTAAVLTVPNTVKWPSWFDATSLETDTIYEILITDGTYGSVMTWAT